MAEGSIMARLAIKADDVICDWCLPPYLAQAVRAIELSGRRDETAAQRIIWTRRAWHSLYWQCRFEAPSPRWNVAITLRASEVAEAWHLSVEVASALAHIERAAMAGSNRVFVSAADAALKSIEEALA